MIRRLPILICLALAGGAACRADEVFPAIHNEPLVVRVLAGKDGRPQQRVRLVLVGGYNRRDLKLRLWQQEAMTDSAGVAHLSNTLRNLPLLHLEVETAHACGATKGEAVFNVEAIRRDGLTSSNHCGRAVVEDEPGVFTVFVKGKRTKAPLSAKMAGMPASPGQPRELPRPADSLDAKEPVSVAKPSVVLAEGRAPVAKEQAAQAAGIAQAAEEPVPAAKEQPLGLEEFAPMLQEPMPMAPVVVVEDRVHVVKERVPTPKEQLSATKRPMPAAKKPAPPADKPMAEAKQAAPAVKETASVAKKPAPGAKPSTPALREPVSAAKKPAAGVRRPVPGPKPAAGVRMPALGPKEKAAAVKETVPVAKASVPGPKPTVPIAKPPSSKVKESAPVLNQPIPIAPLTDAEIDQILMWKS